MPNLSTEQLWNEREKVNAIICSFVVVFSVLAAACVVAAVVMLFCDLGANKDTAIVLSNFVIMIGIALTFVGRAIKLWLVYALLIVAKSRKRYIEILERLVFRTWFGRSVDSSKE